VGFSSPCENPTLRGPLSHLWFSIGLLFLFLSCLLFRVFVVVFASEPASASMCSLSLSPSHYYISITLNISIFSAHLP
jgi:membrane protein implicated in regulation of membrane protease activity